MSDKRTQEETEKEKKAQERVAEYCRLELLEDIDFMLMNPSTRRFIRLVLGPQVSNLLGNNSDGREAAVALVNVMNAARPDTIEVLFKYKEADEHGWN